MKNTWPSEVMSRPQVLPPREEYCSISVPSGLKRMTPLPIPTAGLSGAFTAVTLPPL
ncbi:MAG: hypothetical protein ACK56I_30830 [bacterium]